MKHPDTVREEKKRNSMFYGAILGSYLKFCGAVVGIASGLNISYIGEFRKENIIPLFFGGGLYVLGEIINRAIRVEERHDLFNDLEQRDLLRIPNNVAQKAEEDVRAKKQKITLEDYQI